jgi:hypothetical protein
LFTGRCHCHARFLGKTSQWITNTNDAWWHYRAPARLKFSLATFIRNVINFTFFFSHRGHFWAILW